MFAVLGQSQAVGDTSLGGSSQSEDCLHDAKIVNAHADKVSDTACAHVMSRSAAHQRHRMHSLQNDQLAH